MSLEGFEAALGVVASTMVFVLREVFGFGYLEIAAATDRTPAAVRQVAHQARQHVQARQPQIAEIYLVRNPDKLAAVWKSHDIRR